jgi:O-antigen/teichoic acid export membrane protein
MREKFLVRISFEVARQLLALFTNYILTLKLQVLLYGYIAFANSFVGFSLMFIDLGLTYIYSQHNTEDNFEEYFIVYLFLKAVLIIGNFIPIFIMCFYLNFNPILLNYIFLTIISMAIFHFATPFMTNLITKLKIIKSSLYVFSISLIQNCLILFVAFNIELFPNILEVLGQILVFISIFYLISVIFISRRDFKFQKIDKQLLLKYLKAAKPLIVLEILVAITSNIGRIIIDISYGSEILAYYYFVETIIINTLLIIPIQINSLLNSYLPIEFENNKLKNIEKMTHEVEKICSLVFLSLLIFVLLHGKLLFELFLPAYVNSVNYLYILIFIPFLAGITQPYIAHLIPSKRQHLYSNYRKGKLLIIFILIIFLVPDYLFSIKMLGLGPTGLACIVLSGYSVDVFVYRFISNKIGISTYYHVIYQFIYAITAFLITYIISTFFIRTLISDNFLYLIVSSFILLGIFLIELIAFKELDKKDRKFLFSLLKLSTYKKSLFEEINKSED